MSSNSTDEFGLISRFFNGVGRVGDAYSEADLISLGIGDDCAILQMPPDHELCLSIDTLVSGVHFPENCSPYDLGCRSLAVSLSDLAAMGAYPIAFTLALTLPESDARWLEAFASGLSEVANRYAIRLIGGDTTKGPLTISIQVHGVVAKGLAIKRSGAKPGDLICVSGELGDAAGALDFLNVSDAERQLNGDIDHFLNKYFHPAPQIELGCALRDFASAAIDISDGLLADFNHIAQASGVGGLIYSEKIPLSQSLRNSLGHQALSLALSGGDDYELCFCVSEELFRQCADASWFSSVSVIGLVTADPGLKMVIDGVEAEVSPKGYQHF